MVNPKIFRQYDIRGIVGKDLDVEVLELIGKAYGTYLRRKNLTKAVIGGDARKSTPDFKKAFTKGVLSTGIDLTDIGIVATPVLYFSIWKLKADGGVMITASHNPSEYNGIKMNLGKQSIFGNQIQEILKLIQNEDFETGKGKLGEYTSIDNEYISYILDDIKIERPVKVVVDGGNGMGGPYLPKILRKLGCEVKEMFCEPDGDFPNHHPDPTVKKYMTQLIDEMKNNDAEVGLGIDGDADRIGVIDEKGTMLYGDQILNILVRDFLENNKGEKVIADVKCSKNLFDDIRNYGGEPIMYKTGHSNIKTLMQKENIKVSGEMSGHIFLGDRYLGYDDAIYASARFVEIVSKKKIPVSEYLADQPKMFNTPEIKVESSDDKKFEIVEKIKNSFIDEGYDVNDIDGMRITFEDGWGLCRASNTTPVLVLRFEAESEKRLKEIQNLIEERVNQFNI